MDVFHSGLSRNGRAEMTEKGTGAITATDVATQSNRLSVRRMGINTLHEDVIFMRSDCGVCRSEGFEAHSRVFVKNGHRSIIATLYQVTSDLLGPAEAGALGFRLEAPRARRQRRDNGQPSAVVGFSGLRAGQSLWPPLRRCVAHDDRLGHRRRTIFRDFNFLPSSPHAPPGPSTIRRSSR